MDKNRKQEIKDVLNEFDVSEMKDVISIAEEIMSDAALKNVDEVDTEHFDALRAACELLLNSLPNNTHYMMSDELTWIAEDIGSCYNRYETVRLSDVFWQINHYDCSDEKRLDAMQILFNMLAEGVTAVHFDW